MIIDSFHSDQLSDPPISSTLEIDKLIAERSLRGVLWEGRTGCSPARGPAVTGRLDLHRNRDRKLNGVDPRSYVAGVIQRIADDSPASRWDGPMPWNWQGLDRIPRHAKAA